MLDRRGLKGYLSSLKINERRKPLSYHLVAFSACTFPFDSEVRSLNSNMNWFFIRFVPRQKFFLFPFCDIFPYLVEIYDRMVAV